MRKRVFVAGLGLFLFVSSAARADETCAVEKFVGVTKDDADAIEEIVCTEINEQAPYSGTHRIRVAKLGSKVVLTLVSERGGGRIEKQLILSGLEEVPVAAPRLVEALVEKKPVAETQTVTNIVGQEARTPKKKASEVHAWMGMIAVASPGGGTGGGAHLGLSAGSDRWSFVGDLRLAGQSFAEPAAVALTIFSLGLLKPEPEAKFGYVSLSGGIRHHILATDTAPFVGAGVALDYIGYEDDGSFGKAKQTGVAGYGELGLDLMRTHVIGGAVALRFDAPAFSLEKTAQVGSWSATQSPRIQRSSVWMPVIGASFSLRF
jgi:hypothetical protein